MSGNDPNLSDADKVSCAGTVLGAQLLMPRFASSVSLGLEERRRLPNR